MNLKRVFGATLTILGIAALIYISILFVNTSGGKKDVKAIVVYSILGLLFFIAGLNLLRTTKDEA